MELQIFTVATQSSITLKGNHFYLGYEEEKQCIELGSSEVLESSEVCYSLCPISTYTLSPHPVYCGGWPSSGRLASKTTSPYSLLLCSYLGVTNGELRQMIEDRQLVALVLFCLILVLAGAVFHSLWHSSQRNIPFPRPQTLPWPRHTALHLTISMFKGAPSLPVRPLYSCTANSFVLKTPL